MDKFLTGYKKKSNSTVVMKIVMLALVARVKGTKNRKEALPRKENTTDPIYPSDLQVLLMLR